LIEFTKATVSKIVSRKKETTEVILDIDHEQKRAINYNSITGVIEVGDPVLVNTTACTLNLGTGGYHFIMANWNTSGLKLKGEGHGIKLKYTPIQSKFLLSEEYHANKNFFNHNLHLHGKLVMVGELHSMLSPLCAYLKYFSNECIRIGYIMTDHGALPLAFSRNVAVLKEKNILDVTATTGNAFGGDFECVNIYSSLQAVFSIGQCDIVIITMGPGSLGTGTKYGFSGLELGLYVNLVISMGGKAFYIPRIGFNDQRIRHRGISHHSLTVLKDIIQPPMTLVLPFMKKNYQNIVYTQLKRHGLLSKFNTAFSDGSSILSAIEHYGLCPKTMGRGIDQEPLFFYTLGALGSYVLKVLGKRSRDCS
jgi:hypothetical protein